MSQLKSELKAAAEHCAEAADDASEALGSAVNSASHGVRDAAHRAMETAGHAASSVEEKCHEVGDAARASYEDGRTRGRQWEKKIEGVVRARPLTSILIAAGVGLVGGLLWQCIRSRD